MNKLILTAAAILASVSAFAPAARAQSYNNGDLALLFRINNGTGTGNTEDVEYDLGSASSFNFAVPQTLVNLNTLLSGVYGSSALSNPNLVFTLVGATGGTTEYISDPNNATAFTKTLASSLQGNEQTLANVYGEKTGTQIGSTSGYEVTATDANSYSTLIRDPQNPAGQYNTDYNVGAFGSFAGDTTEESVNPASGTSAIELYSDVVSGTRTSKVYTVADLGSFYISGNNLDFSPASVPEPSTYAMLALGGLALVVIRRRMIA